MVDGDYHRERRPGGGAVDLVGQCRVVQRHGIDRDPDGAVVIAEGSSGFPDSGGIVAGALHQSESADRGLVLQGNERGAVFDRRIEGGITAWFEVDDIRLRVGRMRCGPPQHEDRCQQ